MIYNFIKTSLSIFHWAQAAPTRYRDRSHCKCWPNKEEPEHFYLIFPPYPFPFPPLLHCWLPESPLRVRHPPLLPLFFPFFLACFSFVNSSPLKYSRKLPQWGKLSAWTPSTTIDRLFTVHTEHFIMISTVRSCKLR